MYLNRSVRFLHRKGALLAFDLLHDKQEESSHHGRHQRTVTHDNSRFSISPTQKLLTDMIALKIATIANFLLWTVYLSQLSAIQIQEKDYLSVSNRIMCSTINKIGVIRRFI